MTTPPAEPPNATKLGNTPDGGRPGLALVARLRETAEAPGGWTLLAGSAACLGLAVVLFWSNLEHFFLSWSTDGNYSHGFLVPLIALYFANLAAEKGPVPGPARGGAGLGLALLGVALPLKIATVVFVAGTLGDLAFIATLAGLCALLAGRGVLKRYWFAFAFLVFMVPMPVALYAMIASPLQLLVSRIASFVLSATGVPVLTEGNMMTLPGGVQMFVAEACSGMRQLTGFLALTAAVAYLASRPLWYRAAVILAAVPIAMTANVARVALTGYIMYFVNPQYASGAFHTLEGLVMLGFGLSLLRGGCWALDQLAELVLVPADGAAPEPPPREDPPAGRRFAVQVTAPPAPSPSGRAASPIPPAVTRA